VHIGNPETEENPGLLFLIGCYYSGGISVKQDLKISFKIFEQASGKGSPSSTCMMGYYYKKGLGGVAIDEQRAIEFYIKAAKMGSSNAILDLGTFCSRKTEGWLTNEDTSRISKIAKEMKIQSDTSSGDSPKVTIAKYAFRLCEKASEMGNVDAINNLKICYEEGLGVEKDEEKVKGLYCGSELMKKGLYYNFKFDLKPEVIYMEKKNNDVYFSPVCLTKTGLNLKPNPVRLRTTTAK
jgi:TPR repeat protein